MVFEKNTISEDKTVIPKTLAQFIVWQQPNNGFKYEWNDGELIQFTGINKTHLKLIRILNRLFLKTKAHQLGGELIPENDVHLSGIQMRRPDLAFFNSEQIDKSEDDEPIPEFAIEVISNNDQIYKVEEKIIEYFKAGMKVVWLIFPDTKSVHVYTSRKNVKICIENDICSAAPVLPEFEIGVDALLG
jgi:Uma2 family endonuclease